LVSLDAFRGATMLLMASEIMHGPATLKKLAGYGGSPALQTAVHQLEHLPWAGCVLWDMIQPSFMFMVGVALPFSIASRLARGQSFRWMFLHALWRSFALVALGIFLRSVGRPMTNFTFEDVLTQIGLGYPFLFALGFSRPRWQWAAAGLILLGYWAAFAVYPEPGPEFNYPAVGVPMHWSEHYTGFASHWNKNSNYAAYADQWFLNLFPREQPFEFNRGGYLTLNFVPSLDTMIFGLLAGGLLRSERPHRDKVVALMLAGAVGIALGWTLDWLGVCPMVKRIWTPSWAVFSSGVAAVALAAFYALIDWANFRRWAFPLVVVGMNSIAMYVLVHLSFGFTSGSLKTHFDYVAEYWLARPLFEILGQPYAPIVEGATVLAIFWLVSWWMYRRGVFLRI
jgi:predicted acyltransferase